MTRVQRCLACLTDDCLAPVDIGPCRASVVRWYFDPEDNSCKDFIFGGCDGNTNNFATKDKCERTCTIFVAEGDLRNCFFASDSSQSICSSNPDYIYIYIYIYMLALISFLASISVIKPSLELI